MKEKKSAHIDRNKKKKNWFQKSIRIVGMNPTSFEESWRLVINRIQMISVGLIIVVLLFLFNYLLFGYTPIGFILPEGANSKTKTSIKETAIRTAQLEKKVIEQEKFIRNMQNVILGEITIDSVLHIDDVNLDIPAIELDIDTTISPEEKELQEGISQKVNQTHAIPSESSLFFFEPVSGKISQKFSAKNHPGIDIVAEKGAEIHAILKGIVIYSTFSEEDGNVIVIKHENDLISIYKHLENTYIQSGKRVKTGETIGTVGNTGARSSGTHLHFEIWSNQQPLNPLEYLSFSH